MQSIDDINGFKEKTGLTKYETLSEYNVEHLLRPWAVLAKLKNSAPDNTPVNIPVGTAEFKLSAPSHRVKNSMPEVQTPPVNAAASAVADQGRAVLPAAPTAAVKSPVTESLPTVSATEKERFKALFTRAVQPPQPEELSSAQQRDLPLKAIFERIASCR